MQNLGWKEFDKYDSRNPSTEPSMLPYINPARYEPLAKEVRVSSIPMVNEGGLKAPLLPLSLICVSLWLNSGPLGLSLLESLMIKKLHQNVGIII